MINIVESLFSYNQFYFGIKIFKTYFLMNFITVYSTKGPSVFLSFYKWHGFMDLTMEVQRFSYS